MITPLQVCSLVSTTDENAVAFFSSVHLSSHCPITSEPGLVNESQMDSQVACLLDRVLATCHPARIHILAAKEQGGSIPVPLDVTKNFGLLFDISGLHTS